MDNRYDVIVVGGGHAGCEAAMAASKMGSSVLLITMDMNKFAQMSCNPAVGGIAKGQIVSWRLHGHGDGRFYPPIQNAEQVQRSGHVEPTGTV